jgi:hypothetical protein
MSRPNPLVKFALLVDEVMEQVSILADPTWGGRRIVLRAEKGREPRVTLEPGQRPPQSLAMNRDIGVEEEDQARPGGLGSQVPRRGRTARRREPDDRGPSLLREGSRVVG